MKQMSLAAARDCCTLRSGRCQSGTLFNSVYKADPMTKLYMAAAVTVMFLFANASFADAPHHRAHHRHHHRHHHPVKH
jgi:hypothetical protein